MSPVVLSEVGESMSVCVLVSCLLGECVLYVGCEAGVRGVRAEAELMLRLVSDSVRCMLVLSLGAVTLRGKGFLVGMGFFVCCLVVGMVSYIQGIV